jgi:Ca2+-binding RTX toxin-like protein
MESHSARARARFGRARAICTGILLAVSVGLLAVPSASAVTYPVAGGNGFDTNTEGWSGVTATCSPNAGSMCTEQNLYSGTQGNPAGSIESRMDVIVNGGAVFTAQGTWRSPSFEADANGSGTMQYDRRLDVSGLQTLNPGASVEVLLVNESTGHSLSLGSESLSSANSAFVTRTIAVPDETLSVGDSYHLELHTTMGTVQAQAGLTGSVSTRFDNVALKVRNEGPGGSSGSPGVTFPAPPLGGQQIGSLAQQTPWGADTGQHPGGGVASRKNCTIVGTAHADRIKGSRGNDVICGLGGNDKINGGGGRDIIDGGNGNDVLSGSKGKDVIAGVKGSDRLTGGVGKDRLGGGAGKDRLAGGPGRDLINGGSGKDSVVGGRHDRVTRVERRS